MKVNEPSQHTQWECKYHIVFIPKYRKKVLFGAIRREVGPVLRDLARHRESRVEEGHVMSDHVHMLLSIPPKYSVAQVVGYLKAIKQVAETALAAGIHGGETPAALPSSPQPTLVAQRNAGADGISRG
jgi:putative transposase